MRSYKHEFIMYKTLYKDTFGKMSNLLNEKRNLKIQNVALQLENERLNVKIDNFNKALEGLRR